MTTEPIVYNPTDPDHVENPYVLFDRMRKEEPVYYWERGRSWVLTRYEDVVSLMKDSRFSTDIRKWRFNPDMTDIVPEEVRRYNAKGLFQLDQKGHARVRKLVAPVFTPRRAAKLIPLVQEVVDELLDQMEIADDGTVDCVPALCDPMPLRVIRRILDVPDGQDEAFRAWGQDTVRTAFPVLPPEEYAAAMKRIPAGFALMRELLAERRTTPGDDLLSALILARDEDDRLDEEELVSIVSALLVAGSETTVHLMGRSIISLMRHPEVQAELRADPEKVPAFVEEVLRQDNFGLGGVVRFALEPIEMGGRTIEQGDMVTGSISSAMHDEEVFEDPKRFDMNRDPIPNISFGRGAHFCLGAHLARVEVVVGVKTLLARFSTIESAGQHSYGPNPILRALTSLPIRVQPAT